MESKRESISNRVKLGRDNLTQEWCAIKIMKKVTSTSELESFMNEVKLLSQCEFKHIVGIRSVSVSGILVKPSKQKQEIVYHVTNYAKYGELYSILKCIGPFSEKLARTFFTQLLKGTKTLLIS